MVSIYWHGSTGMQAGDRTDCSKSWRSNIDLEPCSDCGSHCELPAVVSGSPAFAQRGIRIFMASRREVGSREYDQDAFRFSFTVRSFPPE